MTNLSLLAAEREPPSCLSPSTDANPAFVIPASTQGGAESQPLDLCRSRLLDFGYTCLAQEGRLEVSIHSPPGT